MSDGKHRHTPDEVVPGSTPVSPDTVLILARLDGLSDQLDRLLHRLEKENDDDEVE